MCVGDCTAALDRSQNCCSARLPFLRMNAVLYHCGDFQHHGVGEVRWLLSMEHAPEVIDVHPTGHRKVDSAARTGASDCKRAGILDLNGGKNGAAPPDVIAINDI